MKELSEMTIEELWELFPISLVPQRECWKEDYDEIEAVLQKLLSAHAVRRISHIGSTAIAGIQAKNIVDVLVEIPQTEKMESVAETIGSGGFIRMCGDEKRVSFNRGYTKFGFADKVYHIHLRYEGDNDELYFRDYLNDHPETAKEYEKMKLELAEKYEHDRDAYTGAKTDFIRRQTEEAKKLYGERYR